MGILPVILFLLGIVFLFLGWRWQELPKEQDKTVLKGLALLRREITKVHDQVNLLEEEVQKNKQDLQNAQSQYRKPDINELRAEIYELREFQNRREREFEAPKEVQINPSEGINQIELKEAGSNKLEAINDQENKESIRENELPRFVSPKYQKVLELAASGQRVPEIAQNLFLSQDAVQMVLKTHTKGAIR